MQIDSLGVDEDANLSEIRDAVREAKDQDIEAFDDVKISANKDELIEQVNEALEEHVRNMTDPMEMEPIYSEEAFVVEDNPETGSVYVSGLTVNDEVEVNEDGDMHAEGEMAVSDKAADSEPQDSVSGGDASASEEAEEDEEGLSEETSSEEESEDTEEEPPGSVKAPPQTRNPRRRTR